jgi:glucose/arabinose dehydrogenase
MSITNTAAFATILLISFSFIHQVEGQILPAGFSRVRVTNGITNPTCMAFLPDGRILAAEQAGALRVIKNNVLLPAPAITIAVNNTGERGLTGIAVDPDFQSNQYIYLYYCLPNAANNRISRFKFTGDTIDPASELVILNLDPLGSASIHNSGCMRFYDGKLFIAVGENSVGANAQNLDKYLGKLLRINPDGSVPPGNPFTTGSAQRQRIWAYGLRNPFTFDIQQTTGKIYVNDVGAAKAEEINDATIAGRNFGWPGVEGSGSNPAYVNPIFSYSHGVGDGIGCAITGGVFLTPAVSTNYPAQYIGKYFYQDFCTHWINYLDINGGTVTRKSFGTGVGNNTVGLNLGRDGNLYYLDRGLGGLYKIVYSGVGGAPTILSQPVSTTVSAGQPVAFSVTATGSNLNFQWQKNGVAITGARSSTYAIASAVASDAGAYRVVVSNTSGSVTSAAAQLTVTAFNAPPVAEILNPAKGSFYSAGETISFSGQATDPENGTLPPSAFSWSVVFHHDTHSHDGPPIATGVKGGTYTIPTLGETSDNVFYRLYLIVSDAQGLKDTTSVDLLPRKSTINLASEPSGLQVTLDGQPVVAPFSDVSVEGIQRVIGVVSPQNNSGQTYEFDRWLHGGAATQTIFTPAENVTYTAVYIPTASGGLREPENPPITESGLTYYYYEGIWSALPDFNTITVLKSGLIASPNLWPKRIDDDYAFQWTGYIDIPADGEWTFFTSSDEGSQLWIGSTMVVNNDGLHTAREVSGKIKLKKGKHAFNVTFFEHLGSASIAVRWAGPGINKQVIASTAYYRIPSAATATSTRQGSPELIAIEVPAVYPNPAQFNIHVEVIADAGDPVDLSLVNIHGQQIKQQTFQANTNGSNIFTLPVDEIGNGIYEIRIQKGNGYKFKKVVIRK